MTYIKKAHAWMMREPDSATSTGLGIYSTFNFAIAIIFLSFLLENELLKLFQYFLGTSIKTVLPVLGLAVALTIIFLKLVWWLFCSVVEIWTEKELRVPTKYKVLTSIICIPLPIVIYKPSYLLLEKLVKIPKDER